MIERLVEIRKNDIYENVYRKVSKEGKPNGIIVFGANGSGKTTLGRELARLLHFKHIDHEDYAFEKSEIPYAKLRSNEECIKLMLAEIEKHRLFVLSAVTGDFGDEISQYYELAVHLSASIELRIERIKQRAYDKFGSCVHEGGDMYEQQIKFQNFVALRPLSRIEKWAETLLCPVINIDGTEDYCENAANIAAYYNTRFISIGLPSFPDDADVVRRESMCSR